MDARNRSLDDWFTRIRTGQVQLPRFQRFEAWGVGEVTDLLQTVIDELPAGAVLVLEIGDSSPFEARELAGAPSATERMTELLLDGQQRLTALWRSLNDSYPERTFFVDTRDVDNDDDGHRDFRVTQQARWLREGKRFPLWCDDPAQVMARDLIPLGLLNPDDESGWKDWITAAVGIDHTKMPESLELVMKLRARVSRFNLPYLALPVGSSEAVVLNVFVKMNTRSVPLTAFDIIVARLEGETGQSLHDLVAALEGQVPGLSRYTEPADLVLPAAALLQDRTPTQRGQVFLDFKKLLEDWALIVRGAEQTVAFLEQEHIPDAARLPTEVVLAPLVALWAQAPQTPDGLGAARTLLHRYLWCAFCTSRYEFAAATSSFQDYRALVEAVRSGSGVTPNAEIFRLPLPEVEEVEMSGWPKKRDRLARAILAVSFRKGALDLADGATISPTNASHREYHHIFPVALLRTQGIDEQAASRAINCALITWRTNRTISAKAPLQYLEERSAGAPLGEAQVRGRLASHEISYDDLSRLPYEEFLRSRSQAIHSALVALAAGEEWPAA